MGRDVIIACDFDSAEKDPGKELERLISEGFIPKHYKDMPSRRKAPDNIVAKNRTNGSLAIIFPSVS